MRKEIGMPYANAVKEGKFSLRDFAKEKGRTFYPHETL
jgi:hypothetical protein